MFWMLQENILEDDDIDLLVDFVKTTKRFTQFIKVKEFEQAWSDWQGCKYSVFVNSGSSANLTLVAAMKELYGWKAGDEVIVPAVTWVTNISPIMQLGLKPVFVDINLKDLSFEYEQIKEKITNRTRAIFVTHLIGFPADMKKINTIVEGRDIQIMEDCCESHGAKIKEIKVGNFGVGSTFSFYWGHHITTVEGGMICTDNEKLYNLCLLKRSHGLARELPEKYHEIYRNQYPEINFNFLFLTDGFNFRNTELHAVLGLSQIEKLDKYINIRNKNYSEFIDMCKKYKNFFYIFELDGISSFCLPFVFKDNEMKRGFQEKLIDTGIESRPVISGNLLKQPFLKNHGNPSDFKNAELIDKNAFYIGNNQFVNEKRLDALKEIMEEFFSIKIEQKWQSDEDCAKNRTGFI